jgi:hypothetical protein
MATWFALAAMAVLCGSAAGEGVSEPPKHPMPLQPVHPGGRQVYLEGGQLYGRLLDNVANTGRQGSGFNPLCHLEYPGKPIFNIDWTGLNFEHVFNGVTADNERAMFTPRNDPVVLTAQSESEATLYWPADGSKWGMECRMVYRFGSPAVIDMTFTAKPTRNDFPKGYAAFMWASYMACARDRRIHFYGLDGETEGWLAFGEDTPDGIETGTVAYAGVEPLPCDPDAQALNIVEHPTKRFLEPFYYGLIDGDQDLHTTDDTLAYVMMFDAKEPIRFAEWNFVKNDAGQPDTHRPAWDWQFVIRDPQPGQEYRYRARLVIQPFTNPDEIRALYRDWARGGRE